MECGVGNGNWGVETGGGGDMSHRPPPANRRMDAMSTAEENARLRELIVEELARAERWQGHYEALLERQTWLRAQLRPQSLNALEQAARALREQLEEAQGAMREQQEQSRQRQHRIHRRVSEQRESEKTHKQALQQLLVQGDELQRQLWDMETKHQARANRIKETQQHVEELSRTIQELSRRTQVLHGNISCWAEQVTEAQQEAELFQSEVLHGPPRTQPGSLLWEERVWDQTEKLLRQEAGVSGPRGRLPPR
nr:golgin subfamily A member 6-like protein 7 isoform X2 [Pelodiscus sinensis]|eukprot:XP_025042801.1 golgin subfamily A member 6-like protein 7 isoform X2 [Pelodiscus sinensis]